MLGAINVTFRNTRHFASLKSLIKSPTLRNVPLTGSKIEDAPRDACKLNDLSDAASTQFDVCGSARARLRVCRGGVAEERADWLYAWGGVCCHTGTLQVVGYMRCLQ